MDQYWLSCEGLPFEVFFSCLYDGLLGIAYANMLVTTKWPLKRAAHLASLVRVCVVWLPESLMKLSALWFYSEKPLLQLKYFAPSCPMFFSIFWFGCQQDELSTSLTTTNGWYHKYHVQVRFRPCVSVGNQITTTTTTVTIAITTTTTKTKTKIKATITTTIVFCFRKYNLSADVARNFYVMLACTNPVSGQFQTPYGCYCWLQGCHNVVSKVVSDCVLVICDSMPMGLTQGLKPKA